MAAQDALRMRRSVVLSEGEEKHTQPTVIH
jgi:hypothetical protein